MSCNSEIPHSEKRLKSEANSELKSIQISVLGFVQILILKFVGVGGGAQQPLHGILYGGVSRIGARGGRVPPGGRARVPRGAEAPPPPASPGRRVWDRSQIPEFMFRGLTSIR